MPPPNRRSEEAGRARRRPREVSSTRTSRWPSHHLEETNPSKFHELGLMRVEHETTWLLVGELDHVPLCLAHRDSVGELIGSKRRSGSVEIEEVGVQMDGVQRIKLSDVDHVSTL